MRPTQRSQFINSEAILGLWNTPSSQVSPHPFHEPLMSINSTLIGIRGPLFHIYHYYCHGHILDSGFPPDKFCFPNVGDLVKLSGPTGAEAFATKVYDFFVDRLRRRVDPDKVRTFFNSSRASLCLNNLRTGSYLRSGKWAEIH